MSPTKFVYCDRDGEYHEVRCDRAEALRRGVEAARAERYGSGYVARNPATGRSHLLVQGELMSLGAAIIDGEPDALALAVMCDRSRPMDAEDDPRPMRHGIPVSRGARR